MDIKLLDVNWGGSGFPDYSGYMTGDDGPSPAEKLSQQIATTNFQDQQGEKALSDQSLNQFTGPVTDTPYYKSLVTSGTEDTSRAYANAKSNTKAQAHGAGFGENQPIAQGANDQLDQAEAADLAAVPRNAAVAATQPVLQSAAIRNGVTSNFSPSAPLSEFGSLEAARTARNIALQQQQAQQIAQAAPVIFGAFG